MSFKCLLLIDKYMPDILTSEATERSVPETTTTTESPGMNE